MGSVKAGWRSKSWELENFQDLSHLALHYSMSLCHSSGPEAGLDFVLAIVKQTRNFVTSVLIHHVDSSS